MIKKLIDLQTIFYGAGASVPYFEPRQDGTFRPMRFF